MHTVILTLAGLLLLAVFVVAASLIGKGSGRRLAAAARLFIPVWLLVALVNAGIGYFRAGIPFINEMGAFLAIFCVPAIAAWLVASRFRQREFPLRPTHSRRRG